MIQRLTTRAPARPRAFGLRIAHLLGVAAAALCFHSPELAVAQTGVMATDDEAASDRTRRRGRRPTAEPVTTPPDDEEDDDEDPGDEEDDASAPGDTGPDDEDEDEDDDESAGRRDPAPSAPAPAPPSTPPAAPLPPVAPRDGDHRLQVGLNFTSQINMEWPFINLAKSNGAYWYAYNRGGGATLSPSLIRNGHIDLQTGLPNSLPANGSFAVLGNWFVGVNKHPQYYAGEYAIEWEGGARVSVNGQPASLVETRSPNRTEFTFTEQTIGTRALLFSNLTQGGLKDLKVFRTEHEELLDRGEIWNPDFLDLLSDYHVIRTMDMQCTNNSPVRSFDDLATMQSAHWGGCHRSQWPAPPFYSIPYEALFNLGVKTGAEMWVHVPIEIGSLKHHSHPDFAKDGLTPETRFYEDADKFRAFVRENAVATLESPEWDKFADEFLERLIASGYPSDRPLYTELGNEVWNFASGFIFSTYYAFGIGEGLADAGILSRAPDPRYGYGALTARWALAMEAAMARRGVNYNIVYVSGSHTALAVRTRWALESMRDYFNHKGVNPGPYFERTGVALTTYSGALSSFEDDYIGQLSKESLVPAWEAEIARDPEGAKRAVREHIVNGPQTSLATRDWILWKWRQHREEAAKFGVKVIGAYEGGSHLEPPRELLASPTFTEWWHDYHWGEYGADVMRQINDAVLAEFPDAILSNFLSVGSVGENPWVDGHYADETAVTRMWREFGRDDE